MDSGIEFATTTNVRMSPVLIVKNTMLALNRGDSLPYIYEEESISIPAGKLASPQHPSITNIMCCF